MLMLSNPKIKLTLKLYIFLIRMVSPCGNLLKEIMIRGSGDEGEWRWIIRLDPS